MNGPEVEYICIPSNHRVHDPIHVFIRDIQPGQGTLSVSVFSCAWSSYWGAMGPGSDVRKFVASCDEGYLANSLIQGRRQFISSRKNEDRETAYLEKISLNIIEALRAQKATP